MHMPTRLSEPQPSCQTPDTANQLKIREQKKFAAWRPTGRLPAPGIPASV